MRESQPVSMLKRPVEPTMEIRRRPPLRSKAARAMTRMSAALDKRRRVVLFIVLFIADSDCQPGALGNALVLTESLGHKGPYGSVSTYFSVYSVYVFSIFSVYSPK